MTWQQAKSKLIMAHTKWVETILEQCKLLKNVLRDHTYLEQSIELANKMGITLNESNILATTSKGIVVSNQDVLNHLTTLKNKISIKRSKNLGTSNIRPSNKQNNYPKEVLHTSFFSSFYICNTSFFSSF